MPVTIRRQDLIAALGSTVTMAARGARVHHAFAVRCPGIDAEGEVSSCRGHFLPQSSSGVALPWPRNVT